MDDIKNGSNGFMVAKTWVIHPIYDSKSIEDFNSEDIKILLGEYIDKDINEFENKLKSSLE